MLRLGESQYLSMVAACLDGFPLEACGLLAGPPKATELHANHYGTSVGTPFQAGADEVVACYPCRNDAASARLYALNPLDHLRADRDAEARGLEILGVYHSHTHTEAYPSPTDVAQAPDPSWHYVLVSLKYELPVVRSYRIVDGKISEELLVVQGR